MIKLVIDENIAFASKAFNDFGNVLLLPGRKISNSMLQDTDILIVRSITKVDEELLLNTSVKFVGTATIGTDHIDLDYLEKNQIAFADAKGCNAFSVAEYVFAAILNLAIRFDFQLKNKSIGIVGVGNVGSKVAAFAEAFGMKVLLNDPPLKRKGDKGNFVELEEILGCDIITLHTPLNQTGIDKTYHMFNESNLNLLKDDAILINSSRGAVIDNSDLLKLVGRKKLKSVLDVWENEPNINIDLLKKVLIATPHIAGYSYEGKVNGTKMIYEELCNFLNREKTFSFEIASPENPFRKLDQSLKLEVTLDSLFKSIYSITNDDYNMRKMILMNEEERITEFDLQRKKYQIRREFNNYRIFQENLDKTQIRLLNKLRFNIID